jgi:hypothetical protein
MKMDYWANRMNYWRDGRDLRQFNLGKSMRTSKSDDFYHFNTVWNSLIFILTVLVFWLGEYTKVEQSHSLKRIFQTLPLMPAIFHAEIHSVMYSLACEVHMPFFCTFRDTYFESFGLR